MGQTNIQNKPNHEVNPDLKIKNKNGFPSLNQRRIDRKLIANYVLQNKNEPTEKPVKTKNEIVLFYFIM
jgi:ATP-dependent RNA helicase DeaD